MPYLTSELMEGVIVMAMLSFVMVLEWISTVFVSMTQMGGTVNIANHFTIINHGKLPIKPMQMNVKVSLPVLYLILYIHILCLVHVHDSVINAAQIAQLWLINWSSLSQLMIYFRDTHMYCIILFLCNIKCSVLQRQSRDTNWNMKRLVYCRLLSVCVCNVLYVCKLLHVSILY